MAKRNFGKDLTYTPKDYKTPRELVTILENCGLMISAANFRFFLEAPKKNLHFSYRTFCIAIHFFYRIRLKKYLSYSSDSF